VQRRSLLGKSSQSGTDTPDSREDTLALRRPP